MSTLYIATYLDIKPRWTAEGIGLIAAHCDASRAEPGNEYIDAFRETGRPNRFMVIESWKDQAVFASHEEAPHTLHFRTKLQAIHSSPYDQRVHNGFTIGRETSAATPDPLYVVTHVDVPPPRREETEVLLRRLAEESRKEKGNSRYDVFQQTSRTNHFTVFAAWKDVDAFEMHEASAHRMEFREALWPMLGAPYDERLFKGFT